MIPEAFETSPKSALISNGVYSTNEFVHTIATRDCPTATRQDWENLKRMGVWMIVQIVCSNESTVLPFSSFKLTIAKEITL